MHPLESAVAGYISAHTILSPGQQPVIVGLSGGADSVALLSILTNIGYRCIALHCNFHLRGEESNRDERHATAIARRLGAEINVLHCDVPDYREKHGGSVEMACRELRYRWFEEIRTQRNAQAIAVAHNESDNIETFFLNLLRGTSLAGLTGMEPRNESTRVVRPLLSVTRKEIELYLADCGLDFVTDSSNAENVYLRNRLRNIILPEIARSFPDANRSITATIRMLRQNYGFYRTAIQNTISTYFTDNGDTIDLIRLTENENDAALLLFEHLRSKGITYSQARQIVASRNASGRRFITQTHRLLIDRGTLREENTTTVISSRIKIYEAPASSLDITQCPFRAYFDISLLERINDIVIRSWQHGDRIKPWGMRGTKKLSDIFNDAKIALDKKDNIPVVTLDGEILWVAGLRNSRLYPVPAGAGRITVMSIDK